MRTLYTGSEKGTRTHGLCMCVCPHRQQSSKGGARVCLNEKERTTRLSRQKFQDFVLREAHAQSRPNGAAAITRGQTKTTTTVPCITSSRQQTDNK